jgi:dihydropteroate synthase
MQLQHSRGALELAAPVVMGVLNVTPDSFSDGGRFYDPGRALAHAQRLRAEGAALIDVGGESTRPGAAAVEVAEELRRVLPVVSALARDPALLVSVDTSSPDVIRACAEAGAVMINDVRALTRPGALAAVAATGMAVCLMHMQGEPAAMQQAPRYGNVVAEVREWLAQRVAAVVAGGVARARICIDPGFGFGKSSAHNLEMLEGLHGFQALGLPLLAGLSRKSLLGGLTGRASDERLAGSVALATIAMLRGAAIVRAHDVAATVDAARVVAALRGVAAGLQE